MQGQHKRLPHTVPRRGQRPKVVPDGTEGSRNVPSTSSGGGATVTCSHLGIGVGV